MNDLPSNSDETSTDDLVSGAEEAVGSRAQRYDEGVVRAFADLKKRAEEYEKEHGKPLPLPKIKH